MRIGRVIGTVTVSRRLESLKPGRLLMVEALDAHAIERLDANAGRATPMPESLVVFDELGAGVGQLIALSEGREAAVPFHPQRVPIDAYNAAILDTVQVRPEVMKAIA
ncbi:MAG: EutN/CcmL family microcompartment protein [Phycisphaeraceae bacterium]